MLIYDIKKANNSKYGISFSVKVVATLKKFSHFSKMQLVTNIKEGINTMRKIQKRFFKKNGDVGSFLPPRWLKSKIDNPLLFLVLQFVFCFFFRCQSISADFSDQSSGGVSIPESGLPSLLINSCMRFSSFCWRRLFITTSGLEMVLVKLVSGMSL